MPLADILLFEDVSKAHHMFLHMADSRMDCVDRLGKLKQELGGRFIWIHCAYLAVSNRIKAVDWRQNKQNKSRMGGWERLPSRAGKIELLKKLRGNL